MNMYDSGNSLRIMQIAEIWMPIGPDITYGGVQRVIRYLDREYVKRGHVSIVAAPADCQVEGCLFSTIEESRWKRYDGFRERVEAKEELERHCRMIIDFLTGKDDTGSVKRVDIIHSHTGFISSHEYRKRGGEINIPILKTLHWPYNPENKEEYEYWRRLQNDRKIFFNAISNAQKRNFERCIEVCDVIYHGIPLEEFPFENSKSDYLFCFGNIRPIKGTHIAIEVAKRTDMRLIIGGEIYTTNKRYYEEMIKPHVDGDQIQFIGPLTDIEKVEWYKRAKALLMPIQFDEPFGLVMIEAMACGTPVIAFGRGSVPEIIKDEETGFVIYPSGNEEQDIREMINTVKRVESIKPRKCREHVEENFSIEKEANAYLSLYRDLVQNLAETLI